MICRFDIQNAVPRSIAFSLDSRFLLEGTQALLMDTQAVMEGTESLQEGVANELNLRDVKTCQRVRRFDMSPVEDVTSIAFSADGKWAITGGAYANPNRIILWDVNTGKELHRYVSDSSRIFPILDVALLGEVAIGKLRFGDEILQVRDLAACQPLGGCNGFRPPPEFPVDLV